MRFFVDGCCPLLLSDCLASRGHDVTHASRINRGAPDEEQADLALSLDRILVSADYDFGELAIRRLKPFVGLVLIGPHPDGLLPVAESLAMRIHDVGDALVGSLALFEVEKTRLRPLPRAT